jgi:hypothetical protein
VLEQELLALDSLRRTAELHQAELQRLQSAYEAHVSTYEQQAQYLRERIDKYETFLGDAMKALRERNYIEASAQERKKAVQADFLKSQEAYRKKKAEEVKLATLSRISTEKKRSQAEQARTEFGRFRMSTQERQALVSVCKTLNVTESQFLRDSVREAVMLLHQ